MKTLLAMMFLLLMVGVPDAQMHPGSLTQVDALTALPINDNGIKTAGTGGVAFWFATYRNFVFYLSHDGKTSYKYILNQAFADKVDRFHNWSDFSHDGASLYVLWNYLPDPRKKLTHCTVSKFDLDAQYRGTTQLEGDYSFCWKIASLDGNTLVVTAAKLDGSPFVGIFQANGQLVRELHLPKDIRLAKGPKAKLEDLEVKTAEDVEQYQNWTIVESDGLGNVVIARRFVDTEAEGNGDHPCVMYILDHNLQLRKFTMEKTKTRYGKTFVLRAVHGHIVTVGSEQADASSLFELWMRAYDYTGRKTAEYRVDTSLGIGLLDWDGRRALFATQTGNPHEHIKHLGIIEGVPQ